MKKEIPILFSTPMVQATLEGRKTMTRRIVKPQPDQDDEPGLVPKILGNEENWGKWYWDTDEGERIVKACPYGEPGDVLWVREKFTKYKGGGFAYAANGHTCYPDIRWWPSIHMPKDACRIWLEVTEVRVERLQYISEDDAKAEGIERSRSGDGRIVYKHYLKPKYGPSPVHSFETLWTKINGAYSWAANPWVWVVSFKVLSTTGKLSRETSETCTS